MLVFSLLTGLPAETSEPGRSEDEVGVEDLSGISSQ